MLIWNVGEIGAGSWFWPVTTVPGSGSDGLPIDEKEKDLYNFFCKTRKDYWLAGCHW